jgi:hypothetical protein
MKSFLLPVALVTSFGLAAAATTASAAVQLSDVFVGGADPNGMPYYRGPALIVAPNGDLIAFAEGRPTPNDPGEITDKLNSVVCRRSTNGGASWGPITVFASSTQYNYSDPRAVVDASAGKTIVMYTQWPNGVGSGKVPPGLGNDSSVTWYRASPDNGLTWNDPVNINAQVKNAAWSQVDNGPGLGIQLRWQTDPTRNGRLVMPAWVMEATAPPPPPYEFRDTALYSDDHGVTWHHSFPASTAYGDEDQIVELTNGNLLREGRPANGIYRTRWISTDGGATWGDAYAGDVPVNVVNCGLLRYSAKPAGDDRNRILFSGPLGAAPGHTTGSGDDRANLGIWTSYDEGKTFINPVQIASGFCSYSTMEKLRNGSIVVAYEATEATLHRLAKFVLTDLEGQDVSSHLTHYDGFGNNIDRNRGGIGWSGSWTGTGAAANDYRAELGGKGLSFAGSPLSAEDGRMDLTPGHNTAKRELATTINLNANSTSYVSLLISRALDTGPFSGKPLDIQLRDSNEVSRAAFGVNPSGQFYIDTLGDNVHTTAALDDSAVYLAVLKIVSQDGGAGNSDRLYLKVFKSGVDAIPESDANLAWTLVGATGANSSAILDRILLTGGSTATWSFDELRIGDTFGAVASNAHAPEPRSVVLLLSAAPLLLMLRHCRQ